jgi:hypothetical protein
MPVGEESLQLRISSRILGMRPQVVAEREMSTLPLAADGAHVDLVRADAADVLLEVLVFRVGRIGDELVSERFKRNDERLPRHHPVDRDLDVDDRLRGETGDGRRSHMLDPHGDRPECLPEPGRFLLEQTRPRGVVVGDEERSAPASTDARDCSSAAEAREVRQRAEERLLRGVAVSCVLRVPLDAEHPTRLVGSVGRMTLGRELDRLDEPVLAPTGRAESLADPVDSLMVV